MSDSHFNSPAVVGDIISWLAIFGGILSGVLYPLSILAGTIWFLLCIWKDATVQGWIKRHKIARHARQLIKLKRKEAAITTAIARLTQDTVTDFKHLMEDEKL